MNAFIESVNRWGEIAISRAEQVLWQSSLLIVVLLALDLLLRHRVRAGFRYTLWMLLLVKLVLPPSLALPTGAGYWIDREAKPEVALISADPVLVSRPSEVSYVEMDDRAFDLPMVPATIESTPIVVALPPAPTLTRDGWLLATWLAGTIVLLGWMLGRWRWVNRLVRQSEKAPARLQALLASSNVGRAACPTSNVSPAACRQSGSKRRSARSGEANEDPGASEAESAVIASRVPIGALGETRPTIAVRLTDTAMSPAVCGLFRPVILLPRALVNRLTDEQLRTVLLHELIHLRRRDLWVNCAQTLLQIAAWWHPLLWVANARIRRVREEAVDEAVACALRDDADAYPATLLEVAKLTFTRPLMTLGLVGILESKNALKQRIRRLLELPPLDSTRLKWWQWMVVTVIAFTTLPMAEGQRNLPAETLQSQSIDSPSEADSKKSSLLTVSSLSITPLAGQVVGQRVTAFATSGSVHPAGEAPPGKETTSYSARVVARIADSPDHLRVRARLLVESNFLAGLFATLTNRSSFLSSPNAKDLDYYSTTNRYEGVRSYSQSEHFIRAVQLLPIEPAAGEIELRVQHSDPKSAASLANFIIEQYRENFGGTEFIKRATPPTKTYYQELAARQSQSFIPTPSPAIQSPRFDLPPANQEFNSLERVEPLSGQAKVIDNPGIDGLKLETKEPPSGITYELPAGSVGFGARPDLNVVNGSDRGLRSATFGGDPMLTQGTKFYGTKLYAQAEQGRPGTITADVWAVKLDRKAWGWLTRHSDTHRLTSQTNAYIHRGASLNKWLDDHEGVEKLKGGQFSVPEHRSIVVGDFSPDRRTIEPYSQARIEFTPWFDQADPKQVWLKLDSIIDWSGTMAKTQFGLRGEGPEMGSHVVHVTSRGYVNQQFKTDGTPVRPGDWLIIGAPFDRQTIEPIFAVVVQPLLAQGASIDPEGNRLGPVGQPSSDQGSASPQSPAGNPDTEPPQVAIEVRVVELHQVEDQRALGSDWLIPALWGPVQKLGTVNSDILAITLTDPQFRVAIKALEQRTGVQLKFMPRVITPSGRQVQYKLPGPADLASRDDNLRPTGTSRLLDVIPHVAADGSTIQTRLIYMTGELPDMTEPATREPLPATNPVPLYGVRRIVDQPVTNGQTIVLPFQPLSSSLKPGTNGMRTLIFVTPTIIDPAADPTRPTGQSSKDQGSVLPQPRVGNPTADAPQPAEAQQGSPRRQSTAIEASRAAESGSDQSTGKTERTGANAPAALATNGLSGQADNQTVKIQNAKVLMSVGKLDEAEALLREAARIEPGSAEIAYQLDRIQQLKAVRSNRDLVEVAQASPQPNPYAARDPQISTSGGRHLLMEKLNRITLNEVKFERVSLVEVVKELTDEARRRDPSGEGITFMIVAANPSPDEAARQKPAENLDLGETIIDINPALKNLRLIDALNAVVIAADRRIKFTVEEFGVVFTPKPPEKEPLETREFRVNPIGFNAAMRKFDTNQPPLTVAPPPNTILQSGVPQGGGGVRFLTTTNDMSVINAAVLRYFESLGVILTPPKALFFNDRKGLLLVRATTEDFQFIERAIEALVPEPAQIQLEARAVELSPEEVKAMASGFPAYLFPPAAPTNTNAVPASASFSAILTAQQFTNILSGLRLVKIDAPETTGPMRVTTLSGRQSQIKAARSFTVVTNVANTPAGPQYETSDIELGKFWDITPEVGADGYTIHLAAKFDRVEFLGYNDPAAAGKPPGTPLPHFSVRSVSTKASLWDGQTLVMSGITIDTPKLAKDKVPVLGDIPLVGKLFRYEKRFVETKHVVVFITPTIIDPAGNPVHKPGELPLANEPVPSPPTEP